MWNWAKNGLWEWDPLFIELTSNENSGCAIEPGTSNLVGLHSPYVRTGFQAPRRKLKKNCQEIIFQNFPKIELKNELEQQLKHNSYLQRTFKYEFQPRQRVLCEKKPED